MSYRQSLLRFLGSFKMETDRERLCVKDPRRQYQSTHEDDGEVEWYSRIN